MGWFGRWEAGVREKGLEKVGRLVLSGAANTLSPKKVAQRGAHQSQGQGQGTSRVSLSG
jgi:hypothetical protein